MALFKVSKGTSQNLPSTLTEGYCWYTYDDSKFYIDFKDENGTLMRKAINAKDAETLCGMSLEQIKQSISWNDLLDKPFGETVVLTDAYTSPEIPTFQREQGTIDSAKVFSFDLNLFTTGDGYCYIKFNGETYRTQYTKIEDYEVYIGNMRLTDPSDTSLADTGEPFCIYYHEGIAIKSELYTDAEGTYVFTICTTTEGVQTIDEVYIPDTIARVKYVDDKIEASNIIYIGPDEPTDPNIKIWINTSEEGTGTGATPILPRIATITLPASAWTGSSNPWSQVVEMSDISVSTKIDLQPTAHQVVALQNADIALMAENNNCVVTVYALGGKPTTDYTMQVLLTEVSYV